RVRLARALIYETPAAGDVQDPRGVGLRGAEVARDDGVEDGAREELAEEALDGDVEVARTDGLADAAGVEVGHEAGEARLGYLRLHGAALDGADGLDGRGLGGGWEGF